MSPHPNSSRVAVGYIRVSTDDQTDGWSLENQREGIRSWAQRYDIRLEQIVDNQGRGESGKDLERAGWRALEARILNPSLPPVGWVVVARIDRLSRSVADMSRIMRVWQHRDIALIAPGDRYEDPNGHGAGGSLIFWLSWIAEFERKRMLARVIPALEARVAAGWRLGRPPFGYRAPGRPSSREAQALVIDPDTAPLVRDCFAFALSDEQPGLRRLAAWATQRYPQRSWTPTSMQRLLRNRAYVGHLQVCLQGKETIIPHAHPALVSEADFAAVQARLADRASQRSQVTSDANAARWLSGLGRCAVCGATVTVTAVSGEAHYVCASRFRRGGRCTADTQPAEAVETHLVSRLYHAWEQNLALIGTLVTRAVHDLPGHLDAQRSAARGFLDHVQGEAIALLDAYEREALSLESYQQARADLEQRTAAAKLRLAEVDGATYLSRFVQAVDPAGGAFRVHPLPLAFARLTLAERRGFLRALYPDLTLLHPDWPFFRGTPVMSLAAWAGLAPGLSRHLVGHPGYDLRASLRQAGFRHLPTADPGEEVWEQELQPGHPYRITLRSGMAPP